MNFPLLPRLRTRYDARSAVTEWFWMTVTIPGLWPAIIVGLGYSMRSGAYPVGFGPAACPFPCLVKEIFLRGWQANRLAQLPAKPVQPSMAQQAFGRKTGTPERNRLVVKMEKGRLPWPVGSNTVEFNKRRTFKSTTLLPSSQACAGKTINYE